ncbi:hypothetical protein [Paracnuella aquatica]|uniref:hypothetical protein n=1 Tax=Paracnuella aquatica TaxID=2268757 RepID=UPI000F4FBECE|nr:hypothetical protein [Paracnuella aquatica]RPD51389.1 hypothetical protein DRJ53_01515 [Paracnuella aquatica]
MLKRILLATFFVGATTAAFSQNLMHSYGGNIALLEGKKSEFSMIQTAFSYFPRFIVASVENNSVSIGTPLGLGVGLSSDLNGNDAGIFISYDVPMVVDYNIGAKSTPDNGSMYGAYFGAGFGYHKTIIQASETSDFNGATYGPIIRAGFRLAPPQEIFKGQGVTVGVYFKKGIERSKTNTLGFSALVDL